MTNSSGERPTRSLATTRTNGEGATSALLGALPGDEWTIFDRVTLRGRRTPVQVAVGPQGVFVVEARRRRPLGRDELCGQGVRQDVVVRATRAALAVSALTGLVDGVHVTPVVCFLGREVEPMAAGSVVVCSTRNLLAVMTRRPAVLDAEQRQLVALDLDTSIGRPLRLPGPRRPWLG
jgi:hypothetical protein